MARKKNKRNYPPPVAADAKSKKSEPAKPSLAGQPVRETVESLVVAFVLAFLLRTFQAEMFVIPTGSMAPTLMGQHKDVCCEECGQRFKINASSESPENMPTGAIRASFANQAQQTFDPRRKQLLASIARSPAGNVRRQVETLSGVCPSCRFTMAVQADLRPAPDPPGPSPEFHPRQAGDRVLVNKYRYSFSPPERWDVVVFKYPGDATKNYIKRLVGLPQEDLKISGGDVHTRLAGSTGPYEIARKPASKVMAMRQLVHDTDRDASVLHKAGWPLRWLADEDADGWDVEVNTETQNTRQRFLSKKTEQVSWLRYHHTPAPHDQWHDALAGTKVNRAVPQLVTDFNPYNTEILRQEFIFDPTRRTLEPAPYKQGIHWVGDLMIEADVEVTQPGGQLLLDLVEAGLHHQCRFDLETGEAMLRLVPFESTEPHDGFLATAKTALKGTGRYKIRFANFDDELTLWVDGKIAKFDKPTTFAPLNPAAPPQTSDQDLGDLAPVSVGTKNAAVEVTRLQVFRDLYYIAVDSTNGRRPIVEIPFGPGFLVDSGKPVWEIPRDPSLWPLLAVDKRTEVRFSTAKDQFFVMGDNSAASKDCRLWDEREGNSMPGGPYLERSLLIGKAVCVYWPHSWNRVPGTSIPFPLFPNFADMRLVR